MPFKSIHFLPTEGCSAGKASQIASGMKDRKRIQGWRLSDTGIGLMLDLYPDGSGTVADFKGYEPYQRWVVDQMGPSGFVPAKPVATVLPGPKPALPDPKPEAESLGAGAGEKTSKRAKPITGPEQREHLDTD